MGTLIWLIFTTASGFGIGHFFFPEHVILSTVIGFIVGLVLRFFAGSADDVADAGISLFD